MLQVPLAITPGTAGTTIGTASLADRALLEQLIVVDEDGHSDSIRSASASSLSPRHMASSPSVSGTMSE